MRLEALRRIGHTVMPIDTTSDLRGLRGGFVRAVSKAGWCVDTTHVNQKLVQCARNHRPALVWIDKCLAVRAATLRYIRRIAPETRLLYYSLDDMGGRHNQSRQYLASTPLYDLHVTTKSYNVSELRRMGARDVLFVDNAFCPDVHRPVEVTPEERRRLGGPVGFIGAFETQRAEAVLSLASNRIEVRVWGESWGRGWGRWVADHPHSCLRVENGAVFGDDYAKAISSFDVNLCFLRKLNRDRQTTRSIEIPACGGFMLAERTREHEELFEEGLEADFFDSHEELASKCRYYLSHPEARLRIATAGRQRCLLSGYSYDSQLKGVLQYLEKQRTPSNGRHLRMSSQATDNDDADGSPA